MNKTTDKLTVHIRWAIRGDLTEVVDLLELTGEPWTEAELMRTFRQLNIIGMVAESDNRVYGVMVYELRKASLYLMLLAVHPAWQRRGIGCAMVTKLLGKLSSSRRTRVVVDVTDDNLPAQLFYRACGFRATGIRRNAGANGQDVYRMEWRLAEDNSIS